jgi:hypothetical protein
MTKKRLKLADKEEDYKYINNLFSTNSKGIIYRLDWITSADLKISNSIKNIFYQYNICKK